MAWGRKRSRAWWRRADYYYGDHFYPRVNMGERQAQAANRRAQLERKGKPLSPVVIEGHAIARTFWGKAWCDNLESHSDYANRVPRGRSYVRSGCVVDLQIEPGVVRAQVSGSRLYQTRVEITPLPPARWAAIVEDCAGRIDSVVELLAGRLAESVIERLCSPERGLFPGPSEMKFSCSCPDWASMCKHVAAVLYGVAARLDARPELLFVLRKVDQGELIARAGADLARARPAPEQARVLEEADLGTVFGIDLEGREAPAAPRSAPAPARSRPTPAAARPAPSRPRRGRSGRKLETISAAELIVRGIPRTTFQNWVTDGHLQRTADRGVYVVTEAARLRIDRWQKRTSGKSRASPSARPGRRRSRRR